MHRVSLLRAARRLFLMAFIVGQAHLAFAQATVNPSWVEFDPSPDHAALATNGSALVQEYMLSVYVAGQPSAIKSVSLGKPSPEIDGKVRVEFLSTMSPFLTSGVTYEARVAASGPCGVCVPGPRSTGLARRRNGRRAR